MKSLLTTEEIKEWIRRRNREVSVRIRHVPFEQLRSWRFDSKTGNLCHESGKFFSVVGLDVMTNMGCVRRWTQPIISQPEVGYLGIICKEFNGVMHYLLQAKIEPGNVNCVQLSPTLQATRSNYKQVHGGKRPAYLEYFQNIRPKQIVLDQLQSEQGARFLRKRNRNMIIRVEDDIVAHDDFRWLTLEQIKSLMREDNMVNMDTRTVLSGLVTSKYDLAREKSVNDMSYVLHWISELKSRYELVAEKIPLQQVGDGWRITEDEIVRSDRNFFRVIGVDVEISNREVARWCQPLVEPMQNGLCVLLCKRIDGVMHYLLQAKVECGNFDVVELAPTIQCLTGSYTKPIGYVPHYLPEFAAGSFRGKCIFDVVQSEEGGRFYHEQNRNVIYELDADVDLPIYDNYIWLTMSQIKDFLRFNNFLNIQVRSLVSAL